MRTIIIILVILFTSCRESKKIERKADYQVLTIQGDTLNLTRSVLDGHLYLIK